MHTGAIDRVDNTHILAGVFQELDELPPDVSQADYDERSLVGDRSGHLAQTPDALRAAGSH